MKMQVTSSYLHYVLHSILGRVEFVNYLRHEINGNLAFLLLNVVI